MRASLSHMFKLFQSIIFACLTKKKFHVQAISYIAMVKIFFQFKFSVYFIKIEINNPIVEYCQSFPRFYDSGRHI